MQIQRKPRFPYYSTADSWKGRLSKVWFRTIIKHTYKGSHRSDTGMTPSLNKWKRESEGSVLGSQNVIWTPVTPMRWTAHSGHSPELVGQGGTRGPTQYPVLSSCCIPPSGNRGGGSKSPREHWHIQASSSLIVRTTCVSHASPSSVCNLHATCVSFLHVQPACHVRLLPLCHTSKSKADWGSRVTRQQPRWIL